MFDVQMCLLGHIPPKNKLFGPIRDSRTPENLTPESGVGVGVDFFSGVGSGSGLPQMLNVVHKDSDGLSVCKDHISTTR
jgi:hypothetical protein